MEKIIKLVKPHVIITIGLFINAIGWTAFLIPTEITGGGISGVATLIFFATGFPMGISYLIINAILIFVSIKILGPKFVVKTIFSVVVLSILFSVLQGVIHKPVVSEPFMASVIGGILAGVGVGIVFTQGGSTGGTDIIAMIINKSRNISPGRIILYCDIVIISSSYFIFGSIEKVVYGYVTMSITAYCIDLILTGAKQSVQIFIFSKKYNIIAERIANEVGRGITIIDGQGWYTGEKSKVLLIVARKYEASHVFKIVKAIDPQAFISQANVMGVYGKGFDIIKG